MRRFRMFNQVITRRPDPMFLREVTHHAYAIWVRVPGLCQLDRPIRSSAAKDDRATLAYERIAKRLSIELIGGEQRPLAYCTVSMRASLGGVIHDRSGTVFMANQRPAHRGPTATWNCLENWRQPEMLASRFRRLFHVLRATGAKVVIHAEDFSARWCAMTGFRPDGWLLDNPVLTTSDVAEWAGALHAPGWIRECTWVMRDRLATVGAPTDLIHGNIVDMKASGTMSRHLHGIWPPRHVVHWPRGQVLESIADFVLERR